MVAAWTYNATERLIIIDLMTLRYESLKGPIAALTGIVDSALAVTASTSIAIIASSADSAGLIPHATTKAQSTARAIFFPPQNPHYVGPQGCLPPLIISIHGGPTLHSGPGLSLQWQYLTTRGYAIALLNYAGSSGYGRQYREILNGKWGILDVQDAADCARYLSTSDIVDANAIGIIGGSSGGYAALQAICAVSISGISDVEALVKDTHKFESYYPLRLIFGQDVPKDESARRLIYRERSPRFKAQKSKITAWTLLLQGREDQIVPLNQVEAMKSSILSNGGTVKLIVLDGEGHGFPRGAENALRAVRTKPVVAPQSSNISRPRGPET
ncbi:alpha/beta-hydrolase [Penicillium sp. IBT 35674x]|nr:alpha/beta-hydrolase [Penicillium sp. IBT 35674x]